MIKFESQYDETHEKVIIEIASDVTVPDLLEIFKRFLNATGYCVTGEIIINEENPNE